MNTRRAPAPHPAPRPRAWFGTLCAGVVAVAAACGADASVGPPAAGPPAALAIAAGNDQRAAVANALAVEPAVRVTDAAGAPVAGATVSFSVAAGDGWVAQADAVTDADGTAAAAWYLGPVPGVPQRLAAIAGAGGGLAVAFTASADPLVPGTTYTGADGFVEFHAGALPLIVSAPHGGRLEPAGIPNRTGNVTIVRDANTAELAEAFMDAFTTATGSAPHTIIVRLDRKKLDANREIVEAAQGHPVAERAWREYHGFIEAARAHVTAAHGRGFYVDLHGHAHEIARLELGYMLSGTDLARPDDVLNSTALVNTSSIRTLVQSSPLAHTELLRGPTSLGALFEQRGYPSVPSASQHHPGGAPYFSGGYNTRRHGSRDGGTIDGVQLEAYRPGVRETDTERRSFAAAFVHIMREFLETHYDLALVARAAAGAH